MNKAFSTRLVLILFLCLSFSGCSKAAREGKALERANKLFDGGNHEQARIEYLNVQKLNPTNQVAIRRLGEIYYNQADLRKAFAYLMRTKELRPSDIEARRMLARTFLAAGRRKEARDEARAILQLQNDYPDAILLLPETILTLPDIQKTKTELESLQAKIGEKPAVQVAIATLLVMEGNNNTAETMLQKVVKEDPGFGPAYLAQAGIYVGRNDTNKAVQAFELAVQHSKHEKLSIQTLWADYNYRKGNLEEAKNILQKITSSNPQFLPAHCLSAKVAFREKDTVNASNLIKRVLERDPLNYDAQLLSAEMLIAKNQIPKALEIFEVLLKEYPNNAQLHLQCAKAYRANNQSGKAILLLNQAITLSPDYPDAILMLADMNLRRGEFSPVISALPPLLNKNPNLPQGYLLLAQAYEVRNTPSDAFQIYDRFNKLYPKAPAGHYLAGLLHRKSNNLSKARESFQQALEMDTNNITAINQLLEIDLLEGKTKDALSRAEGAIAAFPNSAMPHILKAKIFQYTKNLEGAETSLLKAIDIQPDESQSYLFLAQVYVSANKHAEAISRFEQITAKNTNNINAWMQYGTLQDEFQKYPEAVAAYEKVLAINPDFTPALNNLAFIHAEHFNSLDKAFELAKRARELLPEDPIVADTLGWIMFRRGDYPRALQMLTQSVADPESQPEVLYHLGMTQYALSEEEQARRSFTRALNSTNTFKYRAEAEQKLGFLNARIPEGRAGLEFLESHLKNNPADVIALSRQAEHFDREGKVSEAAKSYVTALNVSPSAMRPLIGLARLTVVKLADEENGTKLVKRIRAISPNDPHATHLAGVIAYRKNDFVQAYELFKDSARVMPDNAELLHDLALAQYALGRMTETKETLARLGNSNPDATHKANASEFLTLISLSEKVSNPMEARAAAEKALTRNPRNLAAMMLLSKSHEAENNRPSALNAYRQLLEINPAFPPAMKGLAMLTAEEDDKSAIEWAEKARASLRNDVELSRVIGFSAYRLGDYRRAIPFLLEINAQNGANAQVLFYLGLAQYQLKRTAEARNYLNQALALDGKSDMAAQARKALAQLK